MFPPQSDDKSKPKPKPSSGKSGPPKPGGGPPDPGAQHNLMRPPGPKPGQGMDPMEAMMGGMGDMGQFAPPAPQAPIGPGGLPIGGSMPGDDPGMDPEMNGSGLFQALNMSLQGGGQDPFASPPSGHGQLDPPPDLNTLLQLMAMMQSGVGGGGLNPSGVVPQQTNPGQTLGLAPFQVTQ